MTGIFLSNDKPFDTSYDDLTNGYPSHTSAYLRGVFGGWDKLIPLQIESILIDRGRHMYVTDTLPKGSRRRLMSGAFASYIEVTEPESYSSEYYRLFLQGLQDTTLNKWLYPQACASLPPHLAMLPLS